jgi:hypothetical protein
MVCYFQSKMGELADGLAFASSQDARNSLTRTAMALVRLRCKRQARCPKGSWRVAAQPRGGGVGPLDPITADWRTTGGTMSCGCLRSNSNGELAHCVATRPVIAFPIIGMPPPSTARAMVLTLLTLLLSSPARFVRLLTTSGVTTQSGFALANTSRNFLRRDADARLPFSSPMSSKATLLLRTLGDPRDS